MKDPAVFVQVEVPEAQLDVPAVHSLISKGKGESKRMRKRSGWEISNKKP